MKGVWREIPEYILARQHYQKRQFKSVIMELDRVKEILMSMQQAVAVDEIVMTQQFLRRVLGEDVKIAQRDSDLYMNFITRLHQPELVYEWEGFDWKQAPPSLAKWNLGRMLGEEVEVGGVDHIHLPFMVDIAEGRTAEVYGYLDENMEEDKVVRNVILYSYLQGDYKDMEGMLERGLAALDERYPPFSIPMGHLLFYMAKLYEVWDKPMLLEGAYRKSLYIYEQHRQGLVGYEAKMHRAAYEHYGRWLEGKGRKMEDFKTPIGVHVPSQGTLGYDYFHDPIGLEIV